MPREHTITVYQFDELSDKAKKKAREWFREGIGGDNSWTEFVIEDAHHIANILGLALSLRQYTTVGGFTKYEPAVFWSIGGGQGDGASFSGAYSYPDHETENIRGHASEDADLHRIAADTLAEIQARNGFKAAVDIKQSDSHYVHSHTMAFEDVGEHPMNEEDFEAVCSLMRAFADWIYKQILEEWDHQNSDECVDENIRANEYEFFESGKRSVL